MRTYISIDMEGIAGVVHESQTDPTNPAAAAEYGRFRRLMTSEANAAVEGAVAAGATRLGRGGTRHLSWYHALAQQRAANTRFGARSYPLLTRLLRRPSAGARKQIRRQPSVDCRSLSRTLGDRPFSHGEAKDGQPTIKGRGVSRRA